jgi:hypothetical protein
MTDDQYYCYGKERKVGDINYSYLYSTESSRYNSAGERGKPTGTNIDDLIRPVWFEKIIKQLESDKNRLRKPNYQKI